MRKGLAGFGRDLTGRRPRLAFLCLIPGCCPATVWNWNWEEEARDPAEEELSGERIPNLSPVVVPGAARLTQPEDILLWRGMRSEVRGQLTDFNRPDSP